MAAHCWDLESSLSQLPVMMKKSSQARRKEDQAQNAVINGARAMEMGHTERKERVRKEDRNSDYYLQRGERCG